MSASTCFCGYPTFADFDGCVDHVARLALVAEVVRLKSLLADAHAAAERARHEHDHPPSGRRPETTILERM